MGSDRPDDGYVLVVVHRDGDKELQLFDALAPRLQLDVRDRQLLSDAALLHDVGYHINYEKHHKHSFHLISHAELLTHVPGPDFPTGGVLVESAEVVFA